MHRYILILFSSVLFSQDYPILGSSGMLDIISWNVEQYPKHSQTNYHLTSIINEINVDVIAFQEITSTASFNSLVSSLDGDWMGYRSGGNSNYGELAYAINLQGINIISVYDILSEDEYYFGYRPPYVLEFTLEDQAYVIINNHFKCCGDDILDLDNSWDEEYRRLIASQLLESYIEENYSLEKVIILGDLNDSISDGELHNVFWGFIESDYFQFADYDIAFGPSNDWSYPSWPSHLDHFIITEPLFSAFNIENVETFKVDNYFPGGWNAYDSRVSDHRPMFLSLDLISQIQGDLNGDQSVDILDVISILNLILEGEYDIVGDMNLDSTMNVMDVVILVNSILN